MISQIKQTSLDLLKIVDDLAQPEIKYRAIMEFWNRIFIPRASKVILRKPDIELKQKLDLCFEKLLPVCQMKILSKGILEGEKLGSPKIPRTNEIKKLLELELNEIL